MDGEEGCPLPPSDGSRSGRRSALPGLRTLIEPPPGGPEGPHRMNAAEPRFLAPGVTRMRDRVRIPRGDHTRTRGGPRRAAAARPHSEAADAGHRQPVRDHRLGPASQPRRLRARSRATTVEAIDTQERNHATQLCREAAREGYDVVVAFGGDGTVNEAANGLVGSDTPLTVPARRLHQRLRPRARHPARRGRRHRAPAAHGRRLEPAPRRPRPRQRPPLHLHRRHRASTPASSSASTHTRRSSALRRLVLHATPR